MRVRVRDIGEGESEGKGEGESEGEGEGEGYTRGRNVHCGLRSNIGLLRRIFNRSFRINLERAISRPMTRDSFRTNQKT